jgi:hypothetical protein
MWLDNIGEILKGQFTALTNSNISPPLRQKALHGFIKRMITTMKKQPGLQDPATWPAHFKGEKLQDTYTAIEPKTPRKVARPVFGNTSIRITYTPSDGREVDSPFYIQVKNLTQGVRKASPDNISLVNLKMEVEDKFQLEGRTYYLRGEITKAESLGTELPMNSPQARMTATQAAEMKWKPIFTDATLQHVLHCQYSSRP